jgi:hypothetical protein
MPFCFREATSINRTFARVATHDSFASDRVIPSVTNDAREVDVRIGSTYLMDYFDWLEEI